MLTNKRFVYKCQRQLLCFQGLFFNSLSVWDIDWKSFLANRKIAFSGAISLDMYNLEKKCIYVSLELKSSS